MLPSLDYDRLVENLLFAAPGIIGALSVAWASAARRARRLERVVGVRTEQLIEAKESVGMVKGFEVAKVDARKDRVELHAVAGRRLALADPAARVEQGPVAPIPPKPSGT
jgi:hypothetical protein